MNWRSQKGVSLIEVMMVTALLATISAVATAYYLQSRKSLREVKYVGVMRAIARDLEKVAKDPESLVFSAVVSANKELANCLWARPGRRLDVRAGSSEGRSSVPVTLCASKNTDPKRQRPVELYRSAKKTKNFKRSLYRVAGTPSDPAWYDINGRRDCDHSNDPKCMFKVLAYFWATCARDANTIRKNVQAGKFNVPLGDECPRAQVINVSYQVSHEINPKFKNSVRSQVRRKFPSIPRELSAHHALSTNVSQISRSSIALDTCEPNETLIEVRNSKAICKCLPPFSESASGILSGSSCILGNHFCPIDTTYMGTDIKGNPICEPIKCETKTYQISEERSFDYYCGPHGWLNGIRSPTGNPRNCTCNETFKRSNPELKTFQHACNFNCSFELTCCYELNNP